MKLYEKALFDAFVWSQAVEESVRDLVTDFVPKKQRGKCGKGGPTFYALIERLRSDVGDEFAQRLHCLREKRNHIVHRSSYVTNRLAPLGEQELGEEIQGLNEVRIVAGDLYGDLLDVRAKLEHSAVPRS